MATSPLIFVLSPGVDPTNQLLQLAEQKGVTFTTIALGQGQSPHAVRLIESGIKQARTTLPGPAAFCFCAPLTSLAFPRLPLAFCGCAPLTSLALPRLLWLHTPHLACPSSPSMAAHTSPRLPFLAFCGCTHLTLLVFPRLLWLHTPRTPHLACPALPLPIPLQGNLSPPLYNMSPNSDPHRHRATGCCSPTAT